MLKKHIINVAILSTLLLSNSQANSPAPVVGGSVISTSVSGIYATGYRASKLLSSKVYNEKGEKIGKVNDIIIGDAQNATVAIIGVGSFLGIPEKFVAIPAVLFETDDKNQLVLPQTEKADLIALPAFRYAR